LDDLEERRLLTTRLHVVGPRYVTVGVQLTLLLKPDWKKNQVGPAAVSALRGFLSPLNRRNEAWNGWQFGRNVYVSEIYELLDQLDGVDYVKPSINQRTSTKLEVLAADSARLKRDPGGQLVAVELFPDELVAASIDDYATKPDEDERTVSITTPAK
jgi:hypothetical protein